MRRRGDSATTHFVYEVSCEVLYWLSDWAGIVEHTELAQFLLSVVVESGTRLSHQVAFQEAEIDDAESGFLYLRVHVIVAFTECEIGFGESGEHGVMCE